MNARFKNPFLLPALIAGFSLMLAGRAPAQIISTQAVTRVTAGMGFCLFTKSDGSLWGMGDNSSGQLGLGSTLMGTNLPQQIVPSGVGVIVAGDGHALFVMGGSLWAMGYDGFGQLGDNSTVTKYVPEQVVPLPRGTSFTGIAAGGNHSLYGTVNSTEGNLLAMGYNMWGQLGDGTTVNHDTPEVITSAIHAKAVTAVAAGEDHSLFIEPDGSLWAMGEEAYGQLGDGVTGPFGTYTSSREQIEPSGVTAIAAGARHSLFVESDGSLYGMGDNGSGQLGDGIIGGQSGIPVFITNNVAAIAAGLQHSLFIKSDGSLWGMGDGSEGQLGDDADFHNYLPVLIVASNVVAVAAGGFNTFFIKSDGSLWGMGDNSLGQLGTGDYVQRNTPVEIVGPPLPQLTITPAGANVILAWPTNTPLFYLQSTATLGSSANWTNVPPGPVVVNGQNTVTNPISGAQQFYRLSQ